MPEFSAGMRLRIRGAEWFVRRAESVREGGQALHVRGITAPVQGRDQVFWTAVEGRIEEIRPENTALALDTSSKAEHTRLRIESVLRRNPQGGDAIALAHHAAMDVMPYQLAPAWQALNSPRDSRSRILMADAVGLGKTLEAGILLTELMVRGRAQRILVVSLKSMMAQFQKELWCRFSIPLVRLDSAGLQRIRSDIPTNHNPFDYYDKAIISVDTLKQDNAFSVALDGSHWDAIVIDEAHNVAARGKAARAQRARLAERLAGLCDHLILLSATPHDGSKESFASLMTLLDPLAIADPSRYTKEDIKGLFVRRFKKDVAPQLTRHFPERDLVPLESSPSLPEAALHSALRELKLDMDVRRRGGEAMFRTGLVKALLSSPAAFLAELGNRIDKLDREDPTSPDLPKLRALVPLAEAIGPADFSKYQKLLSTLRDKATGWKKSAADDRLVIFTERLETKRWLAERLAADLGLPDDALASIDGKMGDRDIMDVVERFGRPASPLRVLLASDVASEGINLHFCSHRLVHFDIPWSLIVFQQRNGRIDRYGQERKPLIYFLLSSVDGKGDDLNVVRHILDRERNAHDNIGDPGQIMQVFDTDAEEKIVRRTYEAVRNGADVDAELDAQIAAARKDASAGAPSSQAAADSESDPLDILSLCAASDTAMGDSDLAASGGSGEASRPLSAPTEELCHVFADAGGRPSERKFLSAGLAFMKTRTGRDFGHVTHDERHDLEVLEVSDSLREWLRRLYPLELRRQISRSSVVNLTENPALMMRETAAARGREIEEGDDGFAEEAWPDVSFLWPLNPVSQWIAENVDASFGSRAAPLLRVAPSQGLPSGACAFLLFGQAPNRHGEPLVQQWCAVKFGPSGQSLGVSVDPLPSLLAQCGLAERNPARPGDVLDAAAKSRLDALRKPAVDAARLQLDAAVEAFRTAESPRNDERLRALNARRERRYEQLDLHFADMDPATRTRQKSRLEAKKRQLERDFATFKDWVVARRTPEDYRYCRIVAVFLAD